MQCNDEPIELGGWAAEIRPIITKGLAWSATFDLDAGETFAPGTECTATITVGSQTIPMQTTVTDTSITLALDAGNTSAIPAGSTVRVTLTEPGTLGPVPWMRGVIARAD